MSKAKTIYLDYAAATPLDPAVLKAMQPYFSEKFFNPSANYSAGQKVRQAVEQAREVTAGWLGARSSEIIFTAGGTEANNLAVHGMMRQYPSANIVLSSVEHESVLAPAAHYEQRLVKVKPDGQIDLIDLKKKIDEKTVLVSVMQANNEVGTIQPIKEVAKVVEATRRQRGPTAWPIYLHTDSCQVANYLDLHTARLGVDLMTLNGGKIYGPKQSGALYVKSTVQLQPLIDGGKQERNLRSGTENVPAIIGFSEALNLAQLLRGSEAKRLKDLQKQFMDLIEKKLPNAQINGSLKKRLPNNIHLTIPGQDNERLLIQLDEAGILAAAGSACSASSEEPSHVLRAMGLSDEAARASLRLTFGRATKLDQLELTVQTLAKCVEVNQAITS